RFGYDVFGGHAGARVQELGDEADLAPSQKRDVDIRGARKVDPAFRRVQPNMAAPRPIAAVKRAQQSGFPRTIVPCKKQEPAGEELEVDTLESKQALAQMMHLEVLREVFHLEYRPGCGRLGRSRSRSREHG